MTSPLVQILYVSGCPNLEPTRALVECAAAELGIAPEIELVEVIDPEAAIALRFLGSPSVRVGGVDVEPQARDRTDFAFSCRVYPGGRGASALPRERWVHDALVKKARATAEGDGTSLK